MSIEISTQVCIGCGLCTEVCPGSLIAITEGKAVILNPERCWGCTSCMKECPVTAIALYLGEDIGGRGGRLTVKPEKNRLIWTVILPNGETKTTITDRAASNQY